jgi:hypothetical protein
LAVFSVISIRESKILPILGIIVAPLSTYLFYSSWTQTNYIYLAGFIMIPVVLLSVATVMKFFEKESNREVFPQRNVQNVNRREIGPNY